MCRLSSYLVLERHSRVSTAYISSFSSCSISSVIQAFAMWPTSKYDQMLSSMTPKRLRFFLTTKALRALSSCKRYNYLSTATLKERCLALDWDLEVKIRNSSYISPHCEITMS